MSIMHHSIPK
jgi:hypothetical protein